MRARGILGETKALFFGFEKLTRELSFAIDPVQLALATLAINFLSLALPLTAMQVYDRIIARSSIDTLHVLAFGVALAVVLEAGLKTLRAWLTGWLGASREHALYRSAMDHVLQKDLRMIEANGAGYNAEELASIGRMREFYSGQALITLVDLPFIFVFLGLMGYLAGVLALVPAVLLLAFCWRAARMGERLKNVLAAREEHDEQRYDFIVQLLSGIHTVKAFGAEESMLRRYEKLEGRSAGANLAVAHASGDAYNDGSLFSQVMSVSVMLAGAEMAVNGRISMGALVACVLLAGRMMQPVQRALGLWARFQEQRIARGKIVTLFSGAPEAMPIAMQETASGAPALMLKKVAFSFNGTVNVLRDCSLTVNRGEMVAVVGQPGGGKSTLLRLIAGLYAPDEGSIAIAGRAHRAFSAEALAGEIGYLPTESMIFQGTIRDNLTGFGAVPESRMLEIARLMNIDADVLKLPLGYDTMLDNTPADPICPGSKQRITLARALMHKPRLLLFDQADRTLDREGYHQVCRLFARLRGQVSMLVVSNDHNLLGLADRTYRLTDGILVEERRAAQPVAIAGYRELAL